MLEDLLSQGNRHVSDLAVMACGGLLCQKIAVVVHGFSGVMRAASFSSDFLPGAYVWFITEALSTGFFGDSGHVVIWFCYVVTGTFILVSESGSRRR